MTTPTRSEIPLIQIGTWTGHQGTQNTLVRALTVVRFTPPEVWTLQGYQRIRDEWPEELTELFTEIGHCIVFGSDSAPEPEDIEHACAQLVYPSTAQTFWSRFTLDELVTEVTSYIATSIRCALDCIDTNH